MDFDKLTGPIDVRKMVDIDMGAEKARRLKRLEVRKKTDDLQLSSFTKLQSLITTLQTSLTSLSSAFSTIASQVNSSNASVATATITANGVPSGTHTLNVTQLAQGQTSTSQAFSTDLGLGFSETLTIANSANAAETFNITVNTGDSLEDIATNINNSSQNTFGITASVIASVALDGVTPQYNLIISSATTGTNSAFTITDADSLFGFTETTTAQNALYSFDTYNEVSQTNLVGNQDGTGGVISGLSFNLINTGTTTLNIFSSASNQMQAVQEAMPDFIDAYNSIMTFIDQTQADHTTYNVAFSNIKAALQSAVNTTFNSSGDVNTISATGLVLAPYQSYTQTVKDLYTEKDYEITYIETGSLMLNTAASQPVFANVLSDDFASLQSFFTSSNGLIANLNNTINNSISYENPAGSSSQQGIIAAATEGVESDLTNIKKQMDVQNKILEHVRDSLTEKWSKTNSVFAKLEMTSKFLDQQFDSILSFGNKK